MTTYKGPERKYNGVKIPFHRAPGNYDVELASDEAADACPQSGESLTVQSMAEDADINVLMKRYGITGKLPENPRVPIYGDFSGISDYQSALHAVMDAQEMFMEYPADVRARFSNDPQLLLEFCSNPANLDEMRKLGLAKPVPAPSVPAPEPAPAAPAAKTV